jgi:hypothetical protein
MLSKILRPDVGPRQSCSSNVADYWSPDSSSSKAEHASADTAADDATMAGTVAEESSASSSSWSMLGLHNATNATANSSAPLQDFPVIDGFELLDTTDAPLSLDDVFGGNDSIDWVSV